MIEKSHTTNDNDVTRVKSADSNSELALNLKPSATSSSTQPATRIMGGNHDSGSLADIQLEIGSVIKDTFELVALLGEGGMGTVLKH